MTTWPQSLQAVMRSYHGSIPQSFHTSDLALPDDADIKVRQALSGHSLLAFHCTRLMDHEAEKVKTEGLRAFGTELFDDRIREAFNHGAFGADIRQELLTNHMEAAEIGRRGNRTGVSLLLGRRVFIDDEGGLEPLLSTWGGEGIYFATGTARLRPLLESMGRPTLVTATVPVLPSRSGQVCMPSLGQVFLGVMRELADGWSEVHHISAVLPEAVRALHYPGDGDYDRFPGLPAS